MPWLTNLNSPGFHQTDFELICPRIETEVGKEDTMKILLQHERTGLYLCESGDWTRDPDGAQDFNHTQKLIEYVGQIGMRGVRICVKFRDSSFDEVFPIPPAASRPTVAVA